MAGVRQPANSLPVAQAMRNTGRIMPNRLYVLAPGYNRRQCEVLAKQAVAFVRAVTPKLSGRGAEGIKPYFGAGWFGISFDRSYLWYQEQGTSPFTMTKLAGKVIPMWIDDPLGNEARANPKAKRRITANGRRQILIFRKAAKLGARKRRAVRDPSGRLLRWRDVPASYPGAPGRIAQRAFHDVKGTSSGRIVRVIPRPHMGVRWRNPGVVGREFMQHGIQTVAQMAGLTDNTVYATYKRR